MSTERTGSRLRIPQFINGLVYRTTQPVREFFQEREHPRVTAGTNAFFMQFDGLRVGGFQFPSKEVIDIKREKGQCEGGACVEIVHIKYSPNGERTLLDVHIRGDDRIAFGGASYRQRDGNSEDLSERIDTNGALLHLRDRLIERDLIP